jgi:FG-GAP-like repeat
VRRLVVLAGALLLVGSVDASGVPGSRAPSFLPTRIYPTGRSPLSIAIGDLDGDARPDLVTANWMAGSITVLHDLAVVSGGANTVSVHLNGGGGSFQPRVDYPTGNHPWSIAIGDLNGDGEPDLMTANDYGNSVSVLLNRGGSFGGRRDYRTGKGPGSVVISDLNHDRKPDLGAE